MVDRSKSRKVDGKKKNVKRNHKVTQNRKE